MINQEENFILKYCFDMKMKKKEAYMVILEVSDENLSG